jgi:hypothetical protein
MNFHQVVFFWGQDWAGYCKSASDHAVSFDLAPIHSQFLGRKRRPVARRSRRHRKEFMMYSSRRFFLAKKPASLASYNLSKRGGFYTDAKRVDSIARYRKQIYGKLDDFHQVASVSDSPARFETKCFIRVPISSQQRISLVCKHISQYNEIILCPTIDNAA